VEDNTRQRTVNPQTPLWSTKPSFRNLFMKKLTLDRVVPTMSAVIRQMAGVLQVSVATLPEQVKEELVNKARALAASQA
jgi:hypothetical protein